MNHAGNISVLNVLSTTTPGNDGRRLKNFCTPTTVIRHVHWLMTKKCAFGLLHQQDKKLKIAIDSKLNSLTHPPFSDLLHIGPILESLPNVELHDVRHLLKSMPAKSSPTDYISMLSFSPATMSSPKL